jgi:hypothetical protein
VRSREATFWTCFPRDGINAGAPSTARAEPKRALGRKLEVREIQLKNNKLPLSAALDRVIHDSTSQNDWPVIFADALIERGWPRNLRLPQFRSGHRLLGTAYSEVTSCLTTRNWLTPSREINTESRPVRPDLRRSREGRFEPDPIIDGVVEALFASEVPLGCLHRNMSQQELYLL